MNSTSRKAKKLIKSRLTNQVSAQNLQGKFLETVDHKDGNFTLKIRTQPEEMQVNFSEKLQTAETKRVSLEKP